VTSAIQRHLALALVLRRDAPLARELERDQRPARIAALDELVGEDRARTVVVGVLVDGAEELGVAHTGRFLLRRDAGARARRELDRSRELRVGGGERGRLRPPGDDRCARLLDPLLHPAALARAVDDLREPAPGRREGLGHARIEVLVEEREDLTPERLAARRVEGRIRTEADERGADARIGGPVPEEHDPARRGGRVLLAQAVDEPGRLDEIGLRGLLECRLRRAGERRRGHSIECVRDRRGGCRAPGLEEPTDRLLRVAFVRGLRRLFEEVVHLFLTWRCCVRKSAARSSLERRIGKTGGAARI
jgi:hypothetical protein